MFTPWMLAFCLFTISFEGSCAGESKTLYEWNYIDYLFASSDIKQKAVDSGEYNYKASYPIDVDQWRDKTFVTVIRDKGVPSSLNIVSGKTGAGGPLLQPYPSWDWTKTDCTGIVSVYRVAIDKCNRLWVLDNGKIGEKKACPAQLLTFDLTTDKLLKRVIIPDDIAASKSNVGLLITPIVQTAGPHCERTTVYIADVEGQALIVYNGQRFKRIVSAALHYDPNATNYTIEGQSFSLEDGPLGMDISPLSNRLYLSPMSSYNLVSADTNDLRWRTYGIQFQVAKDFFSTQSSAKAFSRDGSLFFGLVNNTAIGCWNEYRPPTRSNTVIVAKNPKTLQFTSGMKVKQGPRERLLYFTNRYQKIATGTLNFGEVNYRIMEADVQALKQNTLCNPPLQAYTGK